MSHDSSSIEIEVYNNENSQVTFLHLLGTNVQVYY